MSAIIGGSFVMFFAAWFVWKDPCHCCNMETKEMRKKREKKEKKEKARQSQIMKEHRAEARKSKLLNEVQKLRAKQDTEHGRKSRLYTFDQFDEYQQTQRDPVGAMEAELAKKKAAAEAATAAANLAEENGQKFMDGFSPDGRRLSVLPEADRRMSVFTSPQQQNQQRKSISKKEMLQLLEGPKAKQ
jgi:hypothetical protein